jgi:hypothetical protein
VNEGGELEELLQVDHAIARRLEVSHLLLEGFGGQDQPSFGLRPDAVIDEDRDKLVA